MTLLEPIIHYLTTCGKKRVNLAQVMAGAGRPRRQVLRVLDMLTREGYLCELSDTPQPCKLGEVGPPRRNPTWKIIKDMDVRPLIKPRKNTKRAKLWRLIRAKHRFTKPDLQIASGATSDTVDQYVRLLEKCGYVRRTGRDGRLVTYITVKINQVAPPSGLFVSAAGGGS